MIIKSEFRHRLTLFADSHAHATDCIAHSEGQLCCLQLDLVVDFLWEQMEEILEIHDKAVTELNKELRELRRANK